MWNIGRDVEEGSRLNDGVLFEPLAVPHARHAAQRVECRLVRLVLVRFRPPGRDGHQLQMDPLGTDRFRGHADGVEQALLAEMLLAATYEPAPFDFMAGSDRRHLSNPLA